jgi:hypothetical protein
MFIWSRYWVCDSISKVISYPKKLFKIYCHLVFGMLQRLPFITQHLDSNSGSPVKVSKVRIYSFTGCKEGVQVYSIHTAPTDLMVILGRQHRAPFWNTFHIVSIDHFIIECQLYAPCLKHSTFHVSFAHLKLAPPSPCLTCMAQIALTVFLLYIPQLHYWNDFKCFQSSHDPNKNIKSITLQTTEPVAMAMSPFLGMVNHNENQDALSSSKKKVIVTFPSKKLRVTKSWGQCWYLVLTSRPLMKWSLKVMAYNWWPDSQSEHQDSHYCQLCIGGIASSPGPPLSWG